MNTHAPFYHTEGYEYILSIWNTEADEICNWEVIYYLSSGDLRSKTTLISVLSQILFALKFFTGINNHPSLEKIKASATMVSL